MREVLQVSIGFVTTCNQRYQAAGVEGLRSHYWGTQGYLNAQQKQELCDWLGQKDAWTMEEVVAPIEDTYSVSYRSTQSYDALLKLAGCSWKQAQPTHPDKEEEQVAKKKRKLWSCWSNGEPRLPVGKSE